MNYKKLITVASVLGLITIFLPFVSAFGEVSRTPMDILEREEGSAFLFILWYAGFLFPLIMTVLGNQTLPLSKIKTIVIILLNAFSIFMETGMSSDYQEWGASLAFGGMLFYLCAAANILAGIMIFKEGNSNVNKDDLKKIAEKGMTIGKATANVATKIAKTAASEVKKEIDNHKSDAEVKKETDNQQSDSE